MMALQPNVATTLIEAVWESGVKDALAQPIIDHLVKLSQELRKVSLTHVAYCKGNLTDLRRILHLSLAKGNPK
jgi:hypothetical protein